MAGSSHCCYHSHLEAESEIEPDAGEVELLVVTDPLVVMVIVALVVFGEEKEKTLGRYILRCFSIIMSTLVLSSRIR